MIISDYKYIIDKKTFSCGIILNFRLYDLSFFSNKDLGYKIDYNKKEIIFTGANQDLLYYGYKTESLIIILGTTKRKLTLKKHFEAFLV